MHSHTSWLDHHGRESAKKEPNMQTATSVKVKTTYLIERIEAERVRLVKLHEKTVASYPNDVANYSKKLNAWKARFIKHLKATTNAEDTKQVCYAGYAHHLSIQDLGPIPRKPNKPRTEPETYELDQLLRLLRASSQDEILVKANSDFFRFI
jgi:hypothetical protein